MKRKSLGQIAYERTLHINVLPWEALPPGPKRYWNWVASGVVLEVRKRDKLKSEKKLNKELKQFGL